MKHWFVLLLFFLSACFVQAQDISVVKFQKLENDLDARVNAPVLDQNGKKCALLKVVTTEKGFTFDVGQLGVVKTVYKPAEVWVYVPKGVNKIKITHPKLGQIKSDDGYYWFPEGGVQEASCYRMEITTARVITTIEEAEIRSGYLILTSEPTGASVYITVKGEERYYGKTPMTGDLFPYGNYRYRLSKNMYHQESGEIRVENGRVEKNITLRPAFGYLDIRTQPIGAQVVIEGQDKEYTSPCKLQLPSGSYTVRLTKKLYGTSEHEVVVKDNEITPLNATLDPKFAHLVVNSLPEASVYVDKTFMGKGPKYEVDLLEGLHEVEVQLASHKTVKKQIEIIAKKGQEISLNPTPIYGVLNIKSGSTNDATIFIDNKSYGKAPQVIYEILVGKHTVKLEKTGYESIVKEVVIEEGKMFPFEEMMETRHIPLTVSPSYVNFSANGGTESLDILPHDDWKIEEMSEDSRSWLAIKRGDGYVQVEAKENKTHFPRTETFLISTPTEKEWVYIYQEKATSKIEGSRIKHEWEKFSYGELSCQVDFCKPLLWGMGASLGTYGKKHMNFEVSGSYSGRSISDTSFFNLYVGLKTGYGLGLGSVGCLTPQIGLGWRIFENNQLDHEGVSNAFSLDVSIRLSLGGKFRFILVPEYSFALLSSKGYSTIMPQKSPLKAWRNGFGLRCGLAITW